VAAVRSTCATVPASARAARLKRLPRRCRSAESAAIEDIPSSIHPKETHHERHEAKPLPLRRLPCPGLLLRLPTARRTKGLRLRLRHAVQVRRCLQLRQGLSRTGSSNPRRQEMNIFVLAFLGGIVGAVLMDITETYAARAGITSGVNVALLGRWFMGLTRGQLTHANILDTRPVPGEASMGWAFHFLVGGGGVALMYPALLQLSGISLPTHHLLGGLLFGWATSLLPWFVLLPAFGWGWFGRHGPRGSNALLASTLSHIPYGLGVGAVIALGSIR
jgi:hypothetical protein